MPRRLLVVITTEVADGVLREPVTDVTKPQVDADLDPRAKISLS